jgi:hypothetical protein
MRGHADMIIFRMTIFLPNCTIQIYLIMNEIDFIGFNSYKIEKYVYFFSMNEEYCL